MKQIWSPWRLRYMTMSVRKSGCVFCNALMEEDGTENLIVVRNRYSFVILNLFPYTSGHLMVLPIEHCATMGILTPEARFEIIEQTTLAMKVLDQVYHPQGFNIGMNIGEAAGSGVTEHIHMHVVPRWSGDTNFLTTINETRMIPEDLHESYHKIKQVWKLQEVLAQ